MIRPCVEPVERVLQVKVVPVGDEPAPVYVGALEDIRLEYLPEAYIGVDVLHYLEVEIIRGIINGAFAELVRLAFDLGGVSPSLFIVSDRVNVHSSRHVAFRVCLYHLQAVDLSRLVQGVLVHVKDDVFLLVKIVLAYDRVVQVRSVLGGYREILVDIGLIAQVSYF